MSGFAVSATRLGMPDTGLISYAELVDQGQNICRAASVPLIGDGDTGFGSAQNIKRTVRGYAQAQRSPLPVFEMASHELVQRIWKLENPGPRKSRSSSSPFDAALAKYRGSDYGGPCDSSDAYHALCWRGREPLVELRPEFERWSDVLWRPLFAAMTNDAETDE